MGETVISLRGIQKSYGKHKVLSNVNLDIQKGDIFGLVGKNGAGKTTIFKILLGLSEYQDGHLIIGGKEENLAEERQHIGSNFFPYLTGRQNLEYYRQLKEFKDKSAVDRVLEIIVELKGVKSKFKGYSMGMCQRLGIANALLGNPEILILDEPTNGLDPKWIADVRHLVQKLNAEHGMTVVISSHILGELQNTAHRFGIVDNGTVPLVISSEDLQAKSKAVRIAVDDVDRAKVALEAAGVKILGDVQETQSLEDLYFLMLGFLMLGGETNAQLYFSRLKTDYPAYSPGSGHDHHLCGDRNIPGECFFLRSVECGVLCAGRRAVHRVFNGDDWTG
ncbi:ATP-binding cassette domain-containing protein [Eubacterium aggregans]|uniref:ATP-binding cassette domain-containing protein n=1 Tax=Eubacterium aggregans TaxID=81409 RepID=UPI003F2A816C